MRTQIRPPSLRDPLPPLSWGVTLPAGGRVFYTSQIPLYPDGRLETGAIEDQTRQALVNLAETVTRAGGSLADIGQVQVWLTDPIDGPGMNAVYADFFDPPYPNRATCVVAGLLTPGIRLEIMAQGVIAAPSP